jgi:hypothetical protein
VPDVKLTADLPPKHSLATRLINTLGAFLRFASGSLLICTFRAPTQDQGLILMRRWFGAHRAPA